MAMLYLIKRPLWLLFLISTIGPFSVFGQASMPSCDLPDGMREKLFTALAPFPENTQVAIAWMAEDRECYAGGIVSGDSVILLDNRDSLFEIGSITKVFTATVLSSFVHEGRVGLHDLVWEHLDVAPAGTPAIDLLMLSNHTSGLPRMPSNFLMSALKDMEDPNRHYDEDMMREYLTGLTKLDNPPGEEYAYSNLGAALLGWTLSRVAGLSYDEMVDRYVFEKLGMGRSYGDCEAGEKGLVTGRKPDGSPAKNWDFDVLSGGGSICSTTSDMMFFMRAQLSATDPVLAMTRETSYTVSEKLDMGMGWHILKRPEGRRWHWHNGGTGGYTSSMALDVEKGLGVIILSNVSAFHPEMGNIDQLCFAWLTALY